jgi:SWI/SNF-related matrix-associated actin-dependent regulator of chromatin subfamily A-like protein 1
METISLETADGPLDWSKHETDDDRAKLYSFQQEDSKWLASKKYALLASEMGTGKSAVAITACDLVRAKSVLVLCPAVARYNWMREFGKFSESTYDTTLVLSAEAAGSTTPGNKHLTICSYDLLTNKKVCTWISSLSWGVIVFDEAHYLKNRKAKRTQAAFALHAERIWGLSGTPAPNNAAELWPLLHHFGAYRQDYWSFVHRYCLSYTSPYGVVITGSQRVPELRALLAPFILRRKKLDVLTQLPSIAYHDVAVPASEVDLTLYYPEVVLGLKTKAQLEAQFAEQHAAIESVVKLSGMDLLGVAALSALQTKVGMTRRYTGLQKTPAIAEIINAELEAKMYDKIVIFCIHKDVVDDLMNRLKAYHPMSLYGGTPPDKRERHIRCFQTKPRYQVIICNIQAAGTAITLTAAHQVAFAECSWVPAENAQAAMRVHRIGQTKPVTVRFFGLAGSSDEQVARVLRRKTKDLTALFDNPLD